MPPSGDRPIIIKKIKKGGGHGHHGGAWKVAYADFVTAMMAFFLLLWLLNTTSEEQREGISNYFAPTSISDSKSGSGGILGGQALDSEGALQKPVVPTIAPPPPSQAHEDAPITDNALKEVQEKMRVEDDKAFDEMQQEIRGALEQDPALAKLADNLLLEKTSEGMRIQLIDQDKRPLFASGSREPMDYTRKLMNTVAEIIQKVPNNVAIAGHTDARAYRSGVGYTNWELSADRANAVRRILLSRGVRESRISSVEGRADREPLIKDDPSAAANRRISVTLLYRDVRKMRLDSPNAPIKDGVFQ